LLFGKQKSMTEKSAVPLVAEPITSYEGVGMGGIITPGTLVLALVFLVSFVLYYFVNWKFLSQTWGLS